MFLFQAYTYDSRDRHRRSFLCSFCAVAKYLLTFFKQQNTLSKVLLIQDLGLIVLPKQILLILLPLGCEELISHGMHCLIGLRQRSHWLLLIQTRCAKLQVLNKSIVFPRVKRRFGRLHRTGSAAQLHEVWQAQDALQDPRQQPAAGLLVDPVPSSGVPWSLHCMVWEAKRRFLMVPWLSVVSNPTG